MDSMKLLPKNKLTMLDQSKEKSLGDYSYRDLFHVFINPEYHWDKMYLAKVNECMLNDHDDNPAFSNHFTFIPYDKEKVNEKQDYIFQRLFKEKSFDWCEQGEPLSSESRYWWAQTKNHLLTYLLQREPYHLTEVTWLHNVPQGPMSSIDPKLFTIYIDELGNGDVNQNHCNVYLNVLQSLVLKKPILTLATSLFPNTFKPEILGYTLWLETTSPAEHAGLRKILDRYNLNPKFSLLHTAIDNNVNGHGRDSRDAVE